MEIEKLNEKICDELYKVCFKEPYTNFEKFICGEVQNFNPSGNVVVYVEDSKSSKGLYIIPYHTIKWMLPIKVQNKTSNNDIVAKSVSELAQEYFDKNSNHGVIAGCIATCRSFDLYYDKLIVELLLDQSETTLNNFMKRYIRILNMKQWQGKTFKDSTID